MVFLELIFLFSLFSAETKLLPPVMDDSESSCFFVQSKTHSPEISVLLIPSHTNQKFGTELF